MITQRQENILNTLIQEYINTAKPVSSELLEKKPGFNFCQATIRNEMKKLAKMGYLEQPHTSAGRVPTEKAYKYFAEELLESEEEAFYSFILNEIKTAKQRIEDELKLAESLSKQLSEFSLTLSVTNMPEKYELYDILPILGPSKMAHEKNINLIKSLIKELESF